MPDDAKREQECASLKRIDDSFKKIIIMRDDIKPYHDNNGFYIVGLMDFLLKPDLMEQLQKSEKESIRYEWTLSFDNHSLPIIIWLGTLHSPTFRGMFPHTFLIFPTIYFWYTKHNHLIINSYHFTLLFGTQIVTMNSGFDNESTKKVRK